MMHDLVHTDAEGVAYSFSYDDEDGGNGVVTVRGPNTTEGATLPFGVLMMMIHAYQLDARFDHFERRPVRE